MLATAKWACPIACCLPAIGLSAEIAGAATVQIGAVSEIRDATLPAAITEGGFTVQNAEAAGSYAVPAGYGTITAWSHSTGTAGGSLTFKVYRPTGERRQYVVIGSDTRLVTARTVHRFGVQIPVRPGDRIGLSADEVQLAFETLDTSDRIGFFGSDPAVGSTRSTDGEPFGEYKLDVAATLDDGAPGAAAGDAPGVSQQGASQRPVISRLTLAPPAFAAARRGPSTRASGAGGTKVAFRVDGSADVRFRVQRLRAGRRSGRGASARCVLATPRNRAAAACTRRIPLPVGFTRKAKTGANSFRFMGRLGGLRLRPGSYRLIATPSARGRTGKPYSRIFRITR